MHKWQHKFGMNYYKLSAFRGLNEINLKRYTGESIRNILHVFFGEIQNIQTDISEHCEECQEQKYHTPTILPI